MSVGDFPEPGQSRPGAGPAQGHPAEAAGGAAGELARLRQHNAELLAAQQAFMARVVHDLRAPLRHVTSYGVLVRELLDELRGELPQAPQQVAEALDCMATMERSARRMAAMLDALRALHEAATAPLQPQPVDTTRLVAQVQAQLSERAADRAVCWQVQPAMPWLLADPALLRSALVQLLDNALKFTRGRDPAHIAIQAGALNGRVRLSIEDDGAGFDPQRAQQLFGLFECLHREAEFEGLGTGLALCREIARRHAADIRISAAAGQGCRVELDWPAAPPA